MPVLPTQILRLEKFAQSDHGDDFNLVLYHFLFVLQESFHFWGYHLFFYHFVDPPQEITIQEIWQQRQVFWGYHLFF